MVPRLREAHLRQEILLALTRAAHGSRRLDHLLAFASGQSMLDAETTARLLFEADAGTAAAAGPCPPFSTAIDATLPDERIVRITHLPHRRRWTAVQQPPSGDDVPAQAATEVLARRAAALRSLISGRRSLPGSAGAPVASGQQANSATTALRGIAGGLEIPARLGLDVAAQTPPRTAATARPPQNEQKTPTTPPDQEADGAEWQIMF